LAAADVNKVDQERFKWLEYYKIKFKADAYKVYEIKISGENFGEFDSWAYNQDR
jgi:outer membrane protein insertion porin family